MAEDKDKKQEQPEPQPEPKPQEEPNGNDKPQGSDSGKGEGNSEVERLKAIIGGLNRVVSRKDDEISNLKERIQALEDELAKANSRLQELGEKAEEAEEYKGKLSKLERDLKRKDLVLSKFPELARLEAEGLLPDAEDESELEKKLAAMHKTVLELAKSTAAKSLEGVGPDLGGSGGSPIPESEDALIDAAMKAAAEGDTKAFERYMELLAKVS